MDVEVPALGVAAVHVVPTNAAVEDRGPGKVISDGVTLTMDSLRVRVNKRGFIASIQDMHSGREWLDAPIEWQGFPNTPLEWAAWEIEFADIMSPATLPDPELVRIETGMDGPLRTSTLVTLNYGNSRILQEISLVRRAGRPMIRIDAEIEWNTEGTLLKIAFPVRLEQPMALYDNGLGQVERGVNTEALYEVPAQDWAGLGERDGSAGLVVFSHDKAAWDRPSPGVLRHTLIHSPDEVTTDFGQHRIRITLDPRAKDWSREIHHLSEQITHPLYAFRAAPREADEAGGAASQAFAELDTPEVRLLALKAKEPEQDHPSDPKEGSAPKPRIIVRVAEVGGRSHQEVAMRFPGRRIRSVVEVNGLEDEIGPGRAEGEALIFQMRPHQVRTWMVTFEQPPPEPKPVQSHHLPLEYEVDLLGEPGTSGADRRLFSDDFPGSLTRGEVVFRMADPHKDNGQAVRGRGQTLTWEAKGVTSVHLLVASRSGDLQTHWRAGERKWTRRVPDLYQEIGVWDRTERIPESSETTRRPGWIKRDRLAWHATRLLGKRGEVRPYTYAYLHEIEIPVSPEDRSLQLPEDSRVLVVAATAASDPDPAVQSLTEWRIPAKAAPEGTSPTRGLTVPGLVLVLVLGAGVFLLPRILRSSTAGRAG